jgi:hypothetical protein
MESINTGVLDIFTADVLVKNMESLVHSKRVVIKKAIDSETYMPYFIVTIPAELIKE